MTRLDIISCPQDLSGLTDEIKIFLAGPIQGAPDWQHRVPKIPRVIWICPRRESYDNFDYDEQTFWETLGLRISDAVMFWIPEPEKEIKNHSYAQTTRIEFGENLARGKKIFIGIYKDYSGRKYFQNKLEEYSQEKIQLHDNINSLIEDVKTWVKNRIPGFFFTSDTHFSSERSLTLSRRPFTNLNQMDFTMIERWNKVVPPKFTVFHLGDFGESWPIQYLNGNIKLILGNYENEEKSPIPPVDVFGDIYNINLSDINIWMAHEPLKIKDKPGMKLFGHIHGRQMVKPWDGLDVGVDCHNFTPCSLEDIKFFWNAMNKKYYDSEVWS